MPYQIGEWVNAGKKHRKKGKIRRLKPVIGNRKTALHAARQLDRLFPEDLHAVVKA